MLEAFGPIRNHGDELANSLSPLSIHNLKHIAGLNRSYRRRLQSLARKGKLKADDLPVWLVMFSYLGVINAQS